MINLQLFAESVHGKKIAYLYRLLSEASKEDAVHVAFTTENELSMSRDSESTETKDGPVQSEGAIEIEISTTALLAVGDPMIKKLRNALISGETVEIWRINLAEPGKGDNKFNATYYQGKVSEFTETSSAEEAVECSLTFGVNGTGADGEATVSATQQEMINTYGFADTVKTGA